jgi:hypothetical protein
MSKRVFIGMLAVVAIAFGVAFVNYYRQAPAVQRPKISASLASLSTAPAPWPAELTHLPERLKAINVALLSAEGTATHIHAHIDIYIHGTQTEVPAEIGIEPQGGISPLHTHDASGIAHIESPEVSASYSLGQFFDIWGVKFTNIRIGGYANDAANKLVVYDNGKVVQDPTNLELRAHHEITVTYGTTEELPKIPSSYKFANGL